MILWTTRHSEFDLLEIQRAVARHPGDTPVLLHFHNSAGRRIAVAAGDSFKVKCCETLDTALDRWLEE